MGGPRPRMGIGMDPAMAMRMQQQQQAAMMQQQQVRPADPPHSVLRCANRSAVQFTACTPRQLLSVKHSSPMLHHMEVEAVKDYSCRHCAIQMVKLAANAALQAVMQRQMQMQMQRQMQAQQMSMQQQLRAAQQQVQAMQVRFLPSPFPV